MGFALEKNAHFYYDIAHSGYISEHEGYLMLKQTTLLAACASVAALLGGCATQQPAPVIAGNSGMQAVQSAAVYNNPYGATPYSPAPANDAPYVPPVQSTPVYTPPAYVLPSPAVSGAYIPSYAPVDINAATHTVVRGDTVYNISKRYHVSQEDLRAWNGMADNTLSIGQIVKVKPAGYTAPKTAVAESRPSAQVAAQPTVKPAAQPVVQTATQPAAPVVENKAVSAPAPAVSQASASSSSSTRSVGGIVWQRPTQGKVIADFGGSNKGVDIAGNAGQPVLAAADGKVVYAGSGLRGYGNLVIVQHNSSFLTAYGHNQKLLVGEGQQVKRGQQVALMGNTDASRTQLHFEVRQNGKPVNPNSYIPF